MLTRITQSQIETSLTPFSVSSVGPDNCEFVWSQVAPMIERGLIRADGDALNMAVIKAGVLAGEMQMWAIHDDSEIIAAVVFRIVPHGMGRRLFVVILAGRDMDEWIDELIDRLMDYRDIIGADSMEASCRLGLAKYLQERGWSRKAVVMRAPERN